MSTTTVPSAAPANMPWSPRKPCSTSGGSPTIAKTTLLPRAAAAGEPLLVLGDLVNLVDYRTMDGILADVDPAAVTSLDLVTRNRHEDPRHAVTLHARSGGAARET